MVASTIDSPSVVINGRFLTQPLLGVQRYALEMTRQLLVHFPRSRLYAPAKMPPEAAALDLPVERFGRLPGHLWEQFELPRRLRRASGEVLVSLCNTGPLPYGRQVLTIHDLSFLHEPRWFSRSFHGLYRFLVPRLAARSAAIVTVSHFSRDEIVKHLGLAKEKIRVIPCAVSREFLRRENSLPAPATAGYVLAVSSLDPRKNLKRLILAYRQLKIPDLELWIVGSESYVFSSPELGRLVAKTPGVRLLGRRTDKELSVLYAGARAFVYPTLYEGFGLPPLEAMASDCPVVVSRAASLPEVCGEAAHYVDPFNVEDIARGLREILEDTDLRGRLRERGRERVNAYSWEESGRSLAAVIRGL